ncbi:MAG: serine/threonine protein kinase, partial [Planctomycetales bacterium]|nr:serine/threonine protein kinase [Planctomycetales bacterium]
MHDPSQSNPAYQSLTDQQLSDIDVLCDHFDLELVKGLGPRIEAFLADAPKAAHDGLLAELLAMELEYRTQQGQDPQPDEYVQRFPRQKSVIFGVFGGLAKPPRRGNENIAEDGTAVVGTVDIPPNLENFDCIEVIGRGGMGVVWRADQIQPVKRHVALKLIKSDLQIREVLARFDAEKQALAMMDHQNIARVLDAGTTPDGRPYFVMELVDGIPITQHCDDNKLSVDDRLKLFVSVCNAVQHAHQKGIIHRDLKPSNVLVTVIDDKAVPKVIDFGLAKAVEQSLQLTDATMLTEFGKVVGTVQYMSPEQAELKGIDAQDIDTRTDVYSLGVMLYELLTGSTPLDKETLGQAGLLRILELIREEDPPRPSNRLSSSSHDVNSAIGAQRRLQPARLQQLLRGELDWVVMKALE